jgi:type I restriction-modification system DNA methylase subunit
MDTVVHNQIVNFIWNIADDCLRDVYVRGKYRNVVLPMTIIRRFDAVLEPTKEKVLEMKKNFTKYFYKPIEFRPLEEITADIKVLEAETKGLLEKILED